MSPFCPLASWLPESSSNGNPFPYAFGDQVAPRLRGPRGVVGEVSEGEVEVRRQGADLAVAARARTDTARTDATLLRIMRCHARPGAGGPLRCLHGSLEDPGGRAGDR